MAKTKGKVIMNFEVTPEQREQIRQNAKWFGTSQAEYLRHVALGAPLDFRHPSVQARASERRTAAAT